MESRIPLRALTVLALTSALSLPASAGSPPADSLYQVRSRWTDNTGAKMRLENLRGQPVLITMAYTHCKYSCPLIVEKLKKIEKELSFLPGLRVVLVSFASDETPTSFQAFMKEKGLDPARWKMLAARSPSSVRELATVLEISYKQEKNGDFSHSNVIALLDAEGRVRASLNGLAADTAPLVAKAREKQ